LGFIAKMLDQETKSPTNPMKEFTRVVLVTLLTLFVVLGTRFFVLIGWVVLLLNCVFLLGESGVGLFVSLLDLMKGFHPSL